MLFANSEAVGRRFEIDPDLPGLIGGFWTGNPLNFDMADPQVFHKFKDKVCY